MESDNVNNPNSQVDETPTKSVIKFKGLKLYKPLIAAPNNDTHSTSFTLDNLFYSPSGLLSCDLDFEPIELLNENLDDAYESLKASSIVSPSLNVNTLLTSTDFTTPKSFTTVIDAFRSDFDENV